MVGAELAIDLKKLLSIEASARSAANLKQNYQVSAIAVAADRRCQCPLFIAPTGAGKTFVTSRIVRDKLPADLTAWVRTARRATVHRQFIAGDSRVPLRNL